MHVGIVAAEILLPLLYFVTIWVYAKAFLSGTAVARQLTSPLLIFLILAHSLYLLLRTIEFGHPPITNIFEIFSNIAFCITVAYAYIEFQTKVSGTGYFILMLPFFFQLTSSLFMKDIVEVPEMLSSNLLAVHVTSALLGYAAITISAVYGFLYLMLYHEIKSTRLGVIYKRLPNLEVLEDMSFVGIFFGFLMLTISIVFGYIWLPRASIRFSYTDAKLIGTLAIWVIYGVGLTAKKIAGWHGRPLMVLSMFGFAITMFSMTIINMFFSQFHRFQ